MSNKKEESNKVNIRELTWSSSLTEKNSKALAFKTEQNSFQKPS